MNWLQVIQLVLTGTIEVVRAVRESQTHNEALKKIERINRQTIDEDIDSLISHNED